MYKGWAVATTPLTSPQPGAGIGLRCGNGLVALDYDDDEAALKISEVLPSSVNKAGKRAFTSLHYADFEVSSEDIYDANGRMVAQILSTGRQTVMPPTIHAETKLPYYYTNGKSCHDTPLTELPPLPRDYREKIMALGYTFGGSRRKTETTETPDGEQSEWREVNDTALKNLEKWVPHLGLRDFQRNRGGGASYRAVACYRESVTGRPLEQRDRNLSIHPNGIVDEGIKKGFTPINLVMTYRKCDKWEAKCWLEEKILGPKPDVDWEKIAETKDAPKTVPEDSQSGGPKYRFRLVSFSDLKPGVEPPYLVDELVPLAGIVLVWGKPKCFKSFWTLDLTLHVALGWEYRERYVRQGTVVYCAFEGAHGYKKRIEALRRHYNIDPATDVPLYVVPGQADLIKEHKLLVRDIATQLHNSKPAVVVLDTLNRSLHGSESSDVDMPAYVRAAEAIREAFGCVVIIVHHCGWNETRPRGHSSLPAAIDAQIAVVREGDVLTITMEYMRDGPEDVEETSTVQSIAVGHDQRGKELTSLVLVPGGESVTQGGGRPRKEFTDDEAIAMKHLARLCASDPLAVPTAAKQLPGLAGTSLSQWERSVVRTLWGNSSEKNIERMTKMRKSLQVRDKVDTDGEVVWPIVAPEGGRK
jgi:hypothetical protein